MEELQKYNPWLWSERDLHSRRQLVVPPGCENVSRTRRKSIDSVDSGIGQEKEEILEIVDTKSLPPLPCSSGPRNVFTTPIDTKSFELSIHPPVMNCKTFVFDRQAGSLDDKTRVILSQLETRQKNNPPRPVTLRKVQKESWVELQVISDSSSSSRY